jgi:DtxR family transcriptional regulator, Mn-dependent transcriptional regulator
MKTINTNYEYLITIFILSKQTGTVRSVDIAHEKGISKPAVSSRMKLLLKLEYITMDYRGIILTEKGRSIAETLNRNYSLFKTLLETIGFDESNADEIAYHSAQIMNPKSFKECSDYIQKVS